PAMVCILGTGSNSCYFDGEKMEMLVPSLGYILMDEASGNYFGKKLIVDYFYKRMPKSISLEFEKEFTLDPDYIKKNVYREVNPNMYLASFAKFMFDYKDEKYIKRLIKKGFQDFFKCRVLPYSVDSTSKIYFIGSIAHYFRDILEKVAAKNDLQITGVIQRPIDNLLAYHKENIV
ncbi:MAG: N-acetylglucosamine kinase-like BadF-type ATPase, partial [Polaribacter sp.]